METENLHVVSLGDLGAYGEFCFLLYEAVLVLVSSLDENPPALLRGIYLGSMRRKFHAKQAKAAILHSYLATDRVGKCNTGHPVLV